MVQFTKDRLILGLIPLNKKKLNKEVSKNDAKYI